MAHTVQAIVRTAGLVLLTMTACAQPPQRPITDAPLVGADRDAHGCISSAGYSWSALKQSCIRIFELGTPLRNVRDPDASTVAYVIAEPRAKAIELFLPEQPTPIMLKKAGAIWRDGTGAYTMRLESNVYTVTDVAGAALYQGLQ